jgi:hypothetical protein
MPIQLDFILRSGQHPTRGRGYLVCAYTPTVELLAAGNSSGDWTTVF